ncbi:MAG: Omp28 family outer membrane lipoprotein [Schleiferiaceae bacterium]|nr:Omp28 family outer membrane lipoprotein [Schleiferiaceae bacterium]
MKQLLLSLSIFTLLFMTPSCDVIDQPFKGNIQDTTSTQQQRNVLIEDFTGHRCKNCPKASKAIEALVDAYGSRIIGLAIHAGPGNFTNTNTDYPTDFTTPEGKAIQNFFGTNFLPVGMVNRENWTASGNGHWSPYTNWPTLSSEAIDSTLRIALEASASVNNGNLEVSAKGLPQMGLLHDLNIAVLIKESNIVSPQLMPDDTRDSNYVHMNVLRDYVTDTWGESFGTSPMLPGDTLSGNYTIAWNTDWVQSNAAVVVYVFNPSNYRILQVIEIPVN